MFSSSFFGALAILGSATTVAAQCEATVAFNYTMLSNDTIFSVAEAYNTSVCTLARTNRMADANLTTTGQELLIPAKNCSVPVDDTDLSCFLPDLSTVSPTASCIYGGPHTYTTVTGDTIQRIAEQWFNITVDALLTEMSMGQSYNASTVDITAEIDSGSSMKIPMCADSQCIFQSFTFEYGTYVDLAREYGTTPGQLLAINGGYRYSVASVTKPSLSILVNCTLLSDTVTVIY